MDYHTFIISKQKLLKEFMFFECFLNQFSNDQVRKDFINGTIDSSHKSENILREIIEIQNILMPPHNASAEAEFVYEVAAAHCLALIESQAIPFLIDKINYNPSIKTYKEWHCLLKHLASSSYWKSASVTKQTSSYLSSFKNSESCNSILVPSQSQPEENFTETFSSNTSNESRYNCSYNTDQQLLPIKQEPEFTSTDGGLDTVLLVVAKHEEGQQMDLQNNLTKTDEEQSMVLNDRNSFNENSSYPPAEGDIALTAPLLLNDLPSCPSCCELSKHIDELNRQLVDIKTTVAGNCRIIKEKHLQFSKVPDITTLAPAMTREELDELAQHPDLLSTMKLCIGRNSMDTIRRILRYCLSPDLAQQFSYTGLGMMRKHNKMIFRDHALCHILLDCSEELQLDGTRAAICEQIKICLKSTRDWKGRSLARSGGARGDATADGGQTSQLTTSLKTASHHLYDLRAAVNKNHLLLTKLRTQHHNNTNSAGDGTDASKTGSRQSGGQDRALPKRPPLNKVVSLRKATTTEELDRLAQHPQLMQLMKQCRGRNCNDTVRRILKRCFSRQLAMQYSYSGLGHKRRNCKLMFKSHPLYHRLVEALPELGMPFPLSEVTDAIKRTLRSSGDWDGGRANRRGGSGCGGGDPLHALHPHDAGVGGDEGPHDDGGPTTFGALQQFFQGGGGSGGGGGQDWTRMNARQSADWFVPGRQSQDWNGGGNVGGQPGSGSQDWPCGGQNLEWGGGNRNPDVIDIDDDDDDGDGDGGDEETMDGRNNRKSERRDDSNDSDVIEEKCKELVVK